MANHILATAVEMATMANIFVGDTLETLGFNAISDGGAANYVVYDPSDSENPAGDYTANGMDIIKLTHSGNLVAKLVFGRSLDAEQLGAVDGVEASAKIQRAWDILVGKQASASGEILLRHRSNCTVKNQIEFNSPDGGRVLGANVDFTGSVLTAVTGGNLSTSKAVILGRMEGSQWWGHVNGDRFAAAYDFNGMGGSRSYSPSAEHFKGYGIRVRGGSGRFNMYSPKLNEYAVSDDEFNTDSNFTAVGLSAEDGDFLIYGANILFCKTPVYIASNAVQVTFVNGHFVNGNPNVSGGSGSARQNPMLIENWATRENHFENCYFDNGSIEDHGGTLQIHGGHYVLNSRAVVAEPAVRIYSDAVARTDLPVGVIDGLRGNASIGLLPYDNYTWAGDAASLSAFYADMKIKSSLTEISGTKYRIHLSGEVPSQVNYAPEGFIEDQYAYGDAVYKRQVNMVSGEETLRDLRSFRVRNTSGDSQVMLGGGNVGIREASGLGGKLQIITGSAPGGNKEAWTFLNVGSMVPAVAETVDIGTSDNRVGAFYGAIGDFNSVSVAGGLIKDGTAVNQTIASGVLPVTNNMHRMVLEGGATTDELVMISSSDVMNGDMLTLCLSSNGTQLTVKHNTGNIKCGADFVMSNIHDTATFIYFAGNWRLISFSKNM